MTIEKHFGFCVFHTIVFFGKKVFFEKKKRICHNKTVCMTSFFLFCFTSSTTMITINGCTCSYYVNLISYPKLGICHRLKVPSWTACCLDIFAYDRSVFDKHRRSTCATARASACRCARGYCPTARSRSGRHGHALYGALHTFYCMHQQLQLFMQVNPSRHEGFYDVHTKAYLLVP